MSVEALRKAIYAHATADVSLSAKIGNRIFPEGDVPQNAAMPYVSMRLVTDVPSEHIGGTSSLSRARWQFTCRASTALAATQVGEALIAAFNRHRGAMGAAAAEVTIDDCLVAISMEEPLDPEDASGRGPFGYIVDLAFWYRD